MIRFVLVLMLLLPVNANAATVLTYDFNPGERLSISISPGYESFVGFSVVMNPEYPDLTVFPYVSYWSFFITTEVRNPDGSIAPKDWYGEAGNMLFDTFEKCIPMLGYCTSHHLHYTYGGAYDMSAAQTLYFDGGIGQSLNMRSLSGTLFVAITEVPVPSALILFLTGLGLLVVRVNHTREKSNG